jgi:hypothetical protein
VTDGNLFYADEIRRVYDLIRTEKKNLFLSRPRRFGKTLSLHALNELFMAAESGSRIYGQAGPIARLTETSDHRLEPIDEIPPAPRSWN